MRPFLIRLEFPRTNCAPRRNLRADSGLRKAPRVVSNPKGRQCKPPGKEAARDKQARRNLGTGYR